MKPKIIARNLSVLLAILVTIGLQTKISFADGIGRDTIETYLESALGGKSDRVLKFIDPNPIPVSYVCKTDQCQVNFKNYTHFVSARQFRIEPLVESARIVVQFYSNKSEIDKLESDLAAAPNAVLNDGEDSCHVTILATDNKIEKTVVLVSLQQETSKIQACVAFQIHRGMGLTLPGGANFERVWISNLADSDSKQTLNFYRGSFILLAIHFCSDISPNMTKDQLVQVLTSSTKCTEGIF